MAMTSIFCMVIIAAKARAASSPPIASASVRFRGVICQLLPNGPSTSAIAFVPPDLLDVLRNGLAQVAALPMTALDSLAVKTRV